MDHEIIIITFTIMTKVLVIHRLFNYKKWLDDGSKQLKVVVWGCTFLHKQIPHNVHCICNIVVFMTCVYSE